LSHPQLGPGAVHRLVCETQRRYFVPPNLNGRRWRAARMPYWAALCNLASGLTASIIFPRVRRRWVRDLQR